jgi:hypothetical protein
VPWRFLLSAAAEPVHHFRGPSFPRAMGPHLQPRSADSWDPSFSPASRSPSAKAPRTRWPLPSASPPSSASALACPSTPRASRCECLRERQGVGEACAMRAQRRERLKAPRPSGAGNKGAGASARRPAEGGPRGKPYVRASASAAMGARGKLVAAGDDQISVSLTEGWPLSLSAYGAACSKCCGISCLHSPCARRDVLAQRR